MTVYEGYITHLTLSLQHEHIFLCTVSRADYLVPFCSFFHAFSSVCASNLTTTSFTTGNLALMSSASLSATSEAALTISTCQPTS